MAEKKEEKYIPIPLETLKIGTEKKFDAYIKTKQDKMVLYSAGGANFSEKVREAAYKAADIKSGKLAADIGAGTGFVTKGLVRQGLEVIAVDQSEAMLVELKRKYPDLDGRQGQAEDLPLADDAVDYVFANMYLHHL